MRAVVLLSGGIDSAVAGAMAKQQGYELYALTIRYGQKNEKEIISAARIAQWLGVPRKEGHRIVDIPFIARGSSLTNPDAKIPDTPKAIKDTTYVPGRNLVFLAYACHMAEVIDADWVVPGFDLAAQILSPDVSSIFVDNFNKMQRTATSRALNDHRPIKVWAPLNKFKRRNIIEMGVKLHVPFDRTWTCWNGEEKPCGTCNACRSRAQGFAEAGYPDPLLQEYEAL